MRTCLDCKIEKDVESFYVNKTVKSGRDSKCKDCRKAYSAATYKADPKKAQEAKRKRYYANPEKMREYSRQWYAENTERALASASDWQSRNKDKVRSYAKKGRTLHPAKKNFYTQTYRAKKRGAMPPWLTDEDKANIRGFYAMSARLSQCLGIPHHVDHIYPLQGKTCSGLHVPWNLQVIPATVNIAKGNRL